MSTKVEHGLYRFGQGYWVRVLTAAFAGLLVVAASMWIAGQINAQANFLPKPTWRITLGALKGEPAPGAAIELVDNRAEPPLKIADAVIDRVASVSTQRAEGELVIRDIVLADKNHAVTDARALSAPGLSASVRNPVGIPVLNPTYLSVGGASLVLILGVVLIFYYVGRKHRSVDFLVAVDEEMKRVHWSTYKTIKDSTVVVVGATFIIAGFLFVADWTFSTVYQLIGLLPK